MVSCWRENLRCWTGRRRCWRAGDCDRFRIPGCQNWGCHLVASRDSQWDGMYDHWYPPLRSDGDDMKSDVIRRCSWWIRYRRISNVSVSTLRPPDSITSVASSGCEIAISDDIEVLCVQWFCIDMKWGDVNAPPHQKKIIIRIFPISLYIMILFTPFFQYLFWSEYMFHHVVFYFCNCNMYRVSHRFLCFRRLVWSLRFQLNLLLAKRVVILLTFLIFDSIPKLLCSNPKLWMSLLHNL